MDQPTQTSFRTISSAKADEDAGNPRSEIWAVVRALLLLAGAVALLAWLIT